MWVIRIGGNERPVVSVFEKSGKLRVRILGQVRHLFIKGRWMGDEMKEKRRLPGLLILIVPASTFSMPPAAMQQGPTRDW